MTLRWWQRRPWRPRGGSLQRVLLVGWLVPLWGLVAVICVVQWAYQAQHDATAQDEALRQALAHWPADLSAEPAVSLPAQPVPGVWYRESNLDGERLAGSADLPRVPPTEVVRDPGAVHFYLAQVGDQLVRVAVTLYQPTGVCLLYTSPSPRDQRGSRMPSSA